MKAHLLFSLIVASCTQTFVIVGEGGDTTTPAEPVELLSNGSFEEPALQTGTWSVFNTAGDWKTSFGPGIEIQNNVAGSPFKGSQHVELDSHGVSGMYQDVSTVPGETYVLRFASIARGGTSPEDNLILVVWNGKVIDEITPSFDQWGTYEYEVTAKTKQSRVEFQDASINNSLGAYLDDISLMGQAESFTYKSGGRSTIALK